MGGFFPLLALQRVGRAGAVSSEWPFKIKTQCICLFLCPPGRLSEAAAMGNGLAASKRRRHDECDGPGTTGMYCKPSVGRQSSVVVSSHVACTHTHTTLTHTVTHQHGPVHSTHIPHAKKNRKRLRNVVLRALYWMP